MCPADTNTYVKVLTALQNHIKKQGGPKVKLANACSVAATEIGWSAGMYRGWIKTCVEAGLLKLDGDQIMFTEKGLEFLERMNE